MEGEYPAALASYEDVVASPELFMSTLQNLHATMSTKFMIPIIGGNGLDLHHLFVEVTSRGGLQKVIQHRRWKEITATFNFPSTATNASFVLRKYYASLLHHYEQIYFFKAKAWTNPPISSGPLQTPSNQTIIVEASPALSIGSTVVGVIDGKFETGYLVKISVGPEKLNGLLYQSSKEPTFHVEDIINASIPSSSNNNKGGASSSIIQRRRRRKKCEMKKRDPAHPKPNRSGYNFFFAEQHARLKLMHTGKDRQISKMIGELWNKLKENDRDVYKEKAMKDKERYRREMEEYRERGTRDASTLLVEEGVSKSDSTMLEADDNL